MSCSGSRGTRAYLSMVRATSTLDHSQSSSVFHKALRRARPASNAPTAQAWEEFLDERINRLALDEDVDMRTFAHHSRYLTRAKEEIPDARTFAALKDLDLRVEKAEAAIRRQVASVAAFRSVSETEAAERYRAYREQYLRDFRPLPAGERPDPPEEWVEGFTKKDMMAVSAPADRATLYAIYRCQADPEAFQVDPSTRYASIDLETAGPAGKAGFDPANGAIIEVGVVEYDANEVEVGRYSQLIALPDPVRDTCGTGAVDVHGITVADLDGQPTWAQVAPRVAVSLRGRVMLAQNARFERDWLKHHMAAADAAFDPYGPTVDTMCVARQHLARLDNHRLSTICERVGVDYTAGHRAEHDADVAGRAFFAMRSTIFSTYTSDPVRAAVAQPAPGAGDVPARGRRVMATRLRANDFDPAEISDPWARRPGDAETTLPEAG